MAQRAGVRIVSADKENIFAVRAGQIVFEFVGAGIFYGVDSIQVVNGAAGLLEAFEIFPLQHVRAATLHSGVAGGAEHIYAGVSHGAGD